MKPISSELNLAVALILAIPSAGFSASPNSIDVSNEIDWTINDARIADEQAIQVDLPASSAPIDLGPLPPAAEVVAFHDYDNVYRFFAVDIPTNLSQGLIFPQNAVAWDGQNYYLVFDPQIAAIPSSTGIDALSWYLADGVGVALLSFDVTVQLPGGVTASDEDVVGWDGSTWSMYFDGSARGLPAHLDIDGFDRDPATSTLYFSFDTSGQLGTVFFNDEDVVALNGQNWSLALDAFEVLGSSFSAGDLNALGIRTGVLFRDGFENLSTDN